MDNEESLRETKFESADSGVSPEKTHDKKLSFDERRLRFWFAFILIVFFLFAFGMAGYFVYQNYQLKKGLNKELIPLSSPASEKPSPVIVEDKNLTEARGALVNYFNLLQLHQAEYLGPLCPRMKAQLPTESGVAVQA